MTLDPTQLDAPATEPAINPSTRESLPRWRLILKRTFQAKRAWIGLIVLVFMAFIAYVGPHLYHWDFTDQDYLAFNKPPSASHWFGTNSIGQDILAQSLIGLQKSLLIGLLVGPITAIIAGILGSVAGYVGGIWDRVIVWFIDLLLVLPSFYILVLLSPVFKHLAWVSFVIFLPAFGWMVLARVIRGQTMSLKQRDYVRAARFMGVGGFTIIRRHIIPNVASLLIIDATLGIGFAILSETTLSYFGFGIQPPDVSLGTLLAAGSGAATTRPWLFLPPAALLVATVLASSLLGDALRDAVDPTSETNRA